MLLLLAQRDLTVRFRQTLIGVAWTLLQPLGPMLVFSLIFTRFIQVPSEGSPYALFVLSGLVPWTYFSAAVSGSSVSLISHANMVSKVYFPRAVLPASVVLSRAVDLLVGCGLLLALMPIYGVAPSPDLAALPIVIGMLMLLALAIGLNLAAVNTIYRDVSQALPLVLQLWMFLTPVIYARELVPAEWRWILLLNPVTGAVEAFRAVFLSQPIPWLDLGLSALFSAALFMIGLVLFARMQKHVADYL
jgi:lipopolysaccharide transport system permease protein